MIRFKVLDLAAAYLLLLGFLIVFWATMNRMHGLWLESIKLFWVILPGSYFCGRVLRSITR